MMQRLTTIINKVKEIDMDKIKEIEDYFKIIDERIYGISKVTFGKLLS